MGLFLPLVLSSIKNETIIDDTSGRPSSFYMVKHEKKNIHKLERIIYFVLLKISLYLIHEKQIWHVIYYQNIIKYDIHNQVANIMKLKNVFYSILESTKKTKKTKKKQTRLI